MCGYDGTASQSQLDSATSGINLANIISQLGSIANNTNINFTTILCVRVV